jgi:hypothetical protein
VRDVVGWGVGWGEPQLIPNAFGVDGNGQLLDGQNRVVVMQATA